MVIGAIMSNRRTGTGCALQIATGHLCATPAIGGDAQFSLQVTQRAGALGNSADNGVFGDGITNANIHESYYHLRQKKLQAPCPICRKCPTIPFFQGVTAIFLDLSRMARKRLPVGAAASAVRQQSPHKVRNRQPTDPDPAFCGRSSEWTARFWSLFVIKTGPCLAQRCRWNAQYFAVFSHCATRDGNTLLSQQGGQATVR